MVSSSGIFLAVPSLDNRGQEGTSAERQRQDRLLALELGLLEWLKFRLFMMSPPNPKLSPESTGVIRAATASPATRMPTAASCSARRLGATMPCRLWRAAMLRFRNFSIVLIAVLSIVISCAVVDPSSACTNILVTKGASADGSVMITYACDGEFHPRLRRTPCAGSRIRRGPRNQGLVGRCPGHDPAGAAHLRRGGSDE